MSFGMPNARAPVRRSRRAGKIRRSDPALARRGVGYLLQGFLALFLGPAGRQIAERDDADEPLVAVQHRQPPHRPLAHLAADLLRVLVLEAEADLLRHRIAHLGLVGVAAL